jgi:hypothetical protein
MFEMMSTPDLSVALRAAGRRLARDTFQFLWLVAEFDSRRGWAEGGARSCPEWLHRHTGFSLRTARDHLRVAHALRRLPAVAAAFAEGRVSYSKVRALARIADPANEDVLLAVALGGTAADVEALTRVGRPSAGSAVPADRRRCLRWRRGADGSLLVHARIPPAQAASFLARIDGCLARVGPDIGADVDDPAGEATGSVGPGRRTAGAESDGVADASAIPRPQPAPGAAAPASSPLEARRLDALLELVGVDMRSTPRTTPDRVDETEPPEVEVAASPRSGGDGTGPRSAPTAPDRPAREQAPRREGRRSTRPGAHRPRPARRRRTTSRFPRSGRRRGRRSRR